MFVAKLLSSSARLDLIAGAQLLVSTAPLQSRIRLLDSSSRTRHPWLAVVMDETELNIVEKNPLGNDFDAFCVLFTSVCDS
jgi:hypothetical protein